MNTDYSTLYYQIAYRRLKNRQKFRDAVFIHHAAGNKEPPYEARKTYLEGVLWGYHIEAMTRHIALIWPAMRHTEEAIVATIPYVSHAPDYRSA